MINYNNRLNNFEKSETETEKRKKKGHNLSWEGKRSQKGGAETPTPGGYDIEIEKRKGRYRQIYPARVFIPQHCLRERERVFP